MTLMRRSGVPNPAWMCMPPTKNRRTSCWYAISASSYRRRAVDPLLLPPREGMGGRGDDRGTVPARSVDDDVSGLVQACAQPGDGRADPGAGLDLGAQELVDDLVGTAVGCAGLEDGRVGIGDGIAGVRVHDHQLFFDSEGQVHGGELPGTSPLGGGRGRRRSTWTIKSAHRRVGTSDWTRSSPMRQRLIDRAVNHRTEGQFVPCPVGAPSVVGREPTLVR